MPAAMVARRADLRLLDRHRRSLRPKRKRGRHGIKVPVPSRAVRISNVIKVDAVAAVAADSVAAGEAAARAGQVGRVVASNTRRF